VFTELIGKESTGVLVLLLMILLFTGCLIEGFETLVLFEIVFSRFWDLAEFSLDFDEIALFKL